MRKRKLKLKELMAVKDVAYIDNNTYIATIKGKRLLIVRKGECDPVKCNSACCKFLSLGPPGCKFGKYTKNFGRVVHNRVVIQIKCKHLKGTKCSLWKKKDFPSPCKRYPTLADQHYWVVFGKCSFWFKAIKEVVDLK